MSKIAITFATACFAGVVSCYPPEPPPPPRFRPNPPYAPAPVSPYGGDVDVSPPPLSRPDRPDPPSNTVTGNYPTAERTANPDQVISPYEPYNVIDITDIPSPKSGALARDPSNMKIFRVP